MPLNLPAPLFDAIKVGSANRCNIPPWQCYGLQECKKFVLLVVLLSLNDLNSLSVVFFFQGGATFRMQALEFLY